MTITTATAPAVAAATRSTSSPQAAAPSVNDLVTLDSSQTPSKPFVRGNIVSGIALAAIGCGLVAAASIGIPSIAGLPAVAAFPTGTLMNNAMRFCGLLAFSGAAGQWSAGDDNRTARGALLVAGGVLGMASAFGTFGNVGGLTEVCMGVGGFFTTLNGISKLSGAKSEPTA